MPEKPSRSRASRPRPGDTAARKSKPGARAKAVAKPARARASGARSRAPRGVDRAQLVHAVAERLALAIPEPRCELDHRDAWQLVVATILSAQCTDERVNAVTPTLFRRWKTPSALAGAALEDVEEVVRSTGFYRNKAKSIVATAGKVAREFGGEVPRTMEAMLTLPGVARKTANVVLGTAYGIATGIVVDTHVGRVTRRLGLSASEDPKEVERDLCGLLPREEWIDGGHRLLLHGRYVCLAREPRCAACPVNEICPSRTGPPADTWQARAAAERELVESRGAR
jgi:endonuclease-3